MSTSRKPGWEQQMLDAVDAQGKVTKRVSVGVNYPYIWKKLLIQAAKKRDVSLSTYFRRAAMAFVIEDLGLDWEEVMQDEPRVEQFGNTGTARYLSSKVRGYGYGKWKILGLGEYERDSDG